MPAHATGTTFHKGCCDRVKPCSTWMRKGLVLPHCMNLCLHLAHHITTWESRCFSGQEIQRGGSHGLRLAVMPGKALITFHFCGSVAEQEGRGKTVRVCLGASTKGPLCQIRTGWVTEQNGSPARYHIGPRPKAGSDHISTSGSTAKNAKQ